MSLFNHPLVRSIQFGESTPKSILTNVCACEGRHTCDGPSREELKNRVEELVAVLLALRRGGCWCEMAVGNPMVTDHSAACQRARRAVDA